ncbi:MAG: hypothetical protein KKB31_00820, partial [Nanoarchaeota archaeon]|nr:hypothetical protein [Nanoarchaeota archaeon]
MINKSKKRRIILNASFVLVFAIFLVLLSGRVSAAEVCCEKIAGEEGPSSWCKEAEQSACDTDYGTSPSSCVLADFCTPGWCLLDDGWCDAGTSERSCEMGDWFDAIIPECQMGCCSNYENTEYTTRKTCEILTGSDNNFNPTATASGCAFFSQREGACVYSGGCTWATEERCLGSVPGNLGGIEFREGVYCTTQELED